MAHWKTDHTWSINPDASGAQLYKKHRIVVHWIVSSLLTPAAFSESLIQHSLLFRETHSDPKPVVDR